MALRKSQFYLDNTSGTLTDYSTEINSVSISQDRELLDDTGLNEDWMSRVGGIRDGQVQINGFISQLNTGIAKALLAGIGTSVTKTFQWKVGTRYLNGEALIGAFTPGDVDGKKLAAFSATLAVDGAMNETSVAL